MIAHALKPAPRMLGHLDLCGFQAKEGYIVENCFQIARKDKMLILVMQKLYSLVFVKTKRNCVCIKCSPWLLCSVEISNRPPTNTHSIFSIATCFVCILVYLTPPDFQPPPEFTFFVVVLLFFSNSLTPPTLIPFRKCVLPVSFLI